MANKTPAEYEQEFISSVKEKTGKTLDQWLSIAKKSGISKHKEMVDHFKKEYSLNHLQATLLTGIHNNKGKPFYSNEENLLEIQLEKCKDLRPLFEYISAQLLEKFPGTQMIAKKTYISFTAKREFAAINVKPKEIRLGMDLGTQPFKAPIEKSKLTGPMPRISHMVIITEKNQLNKGIMDAITESYKKVNS